MVAWDSTFQIVHYFEPIYTMLTHIFTKERPKDLFKMSVTVCHV